MSGRAPIRLRWGLFLGYLTPVILHQILFGTTMHPLFKFAVFCVLVYLFIIYISGPATVPGSSGVTGFIFFALTGQVIGAVAAYLVALGVSSEVEGDDDGKFVAMLLGSIIGAILFVTLVYYVANDGHAIHAVQQALGDTTGVKFFGFLAMIFTLLLLIVMALASPFLLFYGVVGLIKYFLYFAMRPPALMEVERSPAGKPFDLKAVMDDLEVSAKDAPNPFFAMVFPGIAKWQLKQKEFWAQKTRERYEQAAATAKAARQTQEERMIAEALGKSPPPLPPRS